VFFYSRQAIKKHLLANHPSVTNVSEAAFTTQLNKALQRGTESGVFLRPKGKSKLAFRSCDVVQRSR
jgi:histone H1/5